jgi:hypothetical protein
MSGLQPLAQWQQQARRVEQLTLAAPADDIQTAGVSKDDGALLALLQGRDTPMLLKGYCRHWPLVQAGLASDAAALAYLQQFDGGQPVNLAVLAAETQGRVFYNADFSGFNYQAGKASFSQLLQQLSLEPQADSPLLYMASTDMQHFFPGLMTDNSLRWPAWSALTSLWLGHAVRVAAHVDFPHNLACNVLGRRTFTLFAPEQIQHLYPGPIEFAPGGQEISLVDFSAVDLQRFPAFAKAQQAALVAELEPGDLLFIPSMWWHHVQGHQRLNGLITHWWRDTPAYLGRPNNALLHAMLSLRSLPKAQRLAWQAWFDYYIFQHENAAVAELPPAASGMLQQPLPELQARQLRALLQNKLKR